MAACAAATSLAKRGAKVVLINTAALAPRLLRAGPRHLRLLVEEQPVLELCQRARRHWEEVDAFAGNILMRVGTLDVGPVTPNPTPAGEAWSRLQNAASERSSCQLMSHETLQAKCPGMRLEAEQLAIWDAEGGLIDAGRAMHAQVALAERAGVDVRLGWQLLGFRDESSHFKLRAAPTVSSPTNVNAVRKEQRPQGATPDERDEADTTTTTGRPAASKSTAAHEQESWFEVEQLLLAPERDAPGLLEVFGLGCDVVVRSASYGGFASPPSASVGLPAIRLLQSPSLRELDAGEADVESGLLLCRDAGGSGLLLQQPPMLGALHAYDAENRGDGCDETWMAAAVQRASAVAPRHLPSMATEELNADRDPGASFRSSLPNLRRAGCELHPVVGEGLPAVGWGWGVEKGRMVVALDSVFGGGGGLDGAQNSCVLGCSAADMLVMTTDEPDIALLSLGRRDLQCRVLQAQTDTWR